MPSPRRLDHAHREPNTWEQTAQVRLSAPDRLQTWTRVAEPGLLIGLTRKSKASVFVVFAGGSVFERKLDGKSAISAA